MMPSEDQVVRSGGVHRHGLGEVAGRSEAGALRGPVIGVVVPANIELGRAVLRGVRAFCKAHGRARMVLLSSSGYHEGLASGSLPVDGIVLQEADRARVAALSKRCPHVVVTSNGRALPTAARVLNDDFQVGRMGAEHLLARGFRTLAFAGAAPFSSSGQTAFQFAVEREAGFIAGAREHGVETHVFEPFYQAQAPTLLAALLELSGPVGVMLSSDLHARWLIEAMGEPHAIVPARLALLGVDDDPLENALSPLGISSVRPAGERLGYEAAALVLELVEGRPVPTEPVRVAPRQVVVRESTSVFAVADALVARALRIARDRIGELADAAALVEALGVPRRTLEARFRAALNSSPARELMRARIERTRELLGGTSLSIKEIAYLVGFSEPRLLSRCFLKETGERPSEFRERVRMD
jgi:LacI family transcriptional regulator